MATGTQPYGQLLDYEQYIDHQLRQTRTRIKMTDILTAGVTLLAAGLGVLLLEVVLDHLVGLPLFVRQVVLAVGLAGGLAYLFKKIVLPAIRSVNSFYAARTIEETDPSFKNSLINYLDLRRHRDELPEAFLAAIEAKAVGDLTKVEVDSVVNQRRLIQMAYVMAGVVLLFCLYVLVTPRSIGDSIKRAFLADVARPTNTRLVNIKPGDDPDLSRVVAGQPVQFAVEYQGTRPQRVVLHYSNDGGQYFATAELAPGKLYDPWMTTVRGLQQSIDYYFTGGDAETRRYHLEVLPAPMVLDPVVVDLDFPTYTGIADRPGVVGGNIEALEGTIATIHAKTNQPASTGKIVFSPASKLDPIAMEVTSADGRELTGKFTVTKRTSYSIQFTTRDDQANPDPPLYDIIAQPDRVPTAKFLHPAPTIKVPANGSARLVAEAGDDFGLKDVILHVQQGDEVLQKAVDLLPKSAVSPRKYRTKPPYVLDLAPLKVKPGTTVEYWLTVRDTKDPVPNRVKTDKQIIQVIDPLPPQKLKEQQAQEDKDLPPPDDANNPENTPPDEPKNPARDKANDQPPPPAKPDQRDPAKDQQPPREDNRPGQDKKDSTPKDRKNPQAQQNQADANDPNVKKLEDAIKKLEQKREKEQQNQQKGGEGSGQGQAAKSNDPNGKPNDANPGDSNAENKGEQGHQQAAPNQGPPQQNAPNRDDSKQQPGQRDPNAKANGDKPQANPVERGNPPPDGGKQPNPKAGADNQRAPGQPDAKSRPQAEQGDRPEQAGDRHPQEPDAGPKGKNEVANDKTAGDQKAKPGVREQSNSAKPAGEKNAENKGEGQGAKDKAGKNDAHGAKPGADSKDARKDQGPGAKNQAGANKKEQSGAKDKGEGAQGKADTNKKDQGPGAKDTADANKKDGQPGAKDRGEGAQGKPGAKGEGAEGKADTNKKDGESAQASPKDGSKADGNKADGSRAQADGKSDANTAPQPKAGDPSKGDKAAGDAKADGKGPRNPADAKDQHARADANKSPQDKTAAQQQAKGKADAQPGKDGEKAKGDRKADGTEGKDKTGAAGKPKDDGSPNKADGRPQGKSGEKEAAATKGDGEKSSKPSNKEAVDTKGLKKSGEQATSKADGQKKDGTSSTGDKAVANDKKDGAAGKGESDARKDSEKDRAGGDQATPPSQANPRPNPGDPLASNADDPNPKTPRKGDDRRRRLNNDRSDNGKPQRNPSTNQNNQATQNNQNNQNTQAQNQNKPTNQNNQTTNQTNQTTNQNSNTNPQQQNPKPQDGTKPNARASGKPNERDQADGQGGDNPSRKDGEAGEKQGTKPGGEPKGDRDGHTASGQKAAGQKASGDPSKKAHPDGQASRSGDPSKGAKTDPNLKPRAAKDGEDLKNAKDTGKEIEGQADAKSPTVRGGKPSGAQGDRKPSAAEKDGHANDGKAQGPGGEKSGKPGGEKPGQSGGKEGNGGEKQGSAGGKPGEKPGQGSSGQQGKGGAGGQQGKPNDGSPSGGTPTSGPRTSGDGVAKNTPGPNASGSGGGRTEAPVGEIPKKEETAEAKPTKPAEPPRKPGASPAPNVSPPAPLTLRKLPDLLKDEESAKELRELTGMSRAQLDQYAEKFKANPAKAAREGKEIEFKPDDSTQTFDPKKLQGSSIRSNAGTRNKVGPNSVAKDTERGNAQGDRAPVPTNLRARFDAYKKSLSRAPAGR